MSLYPEQSSLDVITRVDATGSPGVDRLTLSLQCLDVLTIMATSVVSGWALHAHRAEAAFSLGPYAGIGLIASLIYVVVARLSGLYDIKQALVPRRDYLTLLASWAFAIGFAYLAVYLLQVLKDFSPAYPVLLATAGAIALLHVRGAGKAYIRHALVSGTMNGRAAVVVGTEDELGHLTARDMLLHHGINELVRLQLTVDETCVDPADAYKTSIAEAVAYVRDSGADLVVAVLPWGVKSLLTSFKLQMRALPIRVLLLPDLSLRTLLSRTDISLLPGSSVELQRPALADGELLLKRAFDVLISLFLIVVLLPLFTLVAIAIVIETPGPFIFRQRRVGLNGKIFRILKFRSMTALEDGANLQQARRGDARITKIGRIIRSTSIDELPQLWNVLVGDMSIVGPRPHALAHDTQFDDDFISYAWRRNVKPGITGWAQVNGSRGETSQVEQIRRRVELDAWYVTHCNFWLDVRILCRTFLEVLKFRNAF